MDKDEKIKRIKCLDFDNMLDYPSKDGKHHIYCFDFLPEKWIKFEDEMPKLNQEIEIKFKRGKIEKSRVEAVFLYIEDTYENIKTLQGWRPIKREKRPDFGKLNIGDLIVINYNNGDKVTGFYKKIDDRFIELKPFMNDTERNFISVHTGIKKITRINTEDKTFEEI